VAVYCPRCNTANREGSRYCNNCGSQLETPGAALCPNCKAPIIAYSAFCHRCGARLPEPDRPVVAPPEPLTETDEGEGALAEEAEIISLDEVPATPPPAGSLQAGALAEAAAQEATPMAQPEAARPRPAHSQGTTSGAPEETGDSGRPPEVTPPQVTATPRVLVRVRPSPAGAQPPPKPPVRPPQPTTPDIWRRLAYLTLVVVIVIGLVLPAGSLSGSTPVSTEVRSLYQAIEGLPLHSPVLVSFDYDTTTAGEMQPLAQAVIHHLIRRQARILVLSLSPQGPALADAVITPMAEQNIYAYGVDYVNLGYLAGGEAALAMMGANLPQAFSTDFRQRQPVSELAVMRNITDVTSVRLIIELAGDDSGVRRWVEQVQSRYPVHLVAATTAMALPLAFPYLQSGQVGGLASGLPAAAQYESLLGYNGQATRTMDALSLGQLAILFFIGVANLGLIVRRQPV